MLYGTHAFPTYLHRVANSYLSRLKVPLKDSVLEFCSIEFILAQMSLLNTSWQHNPSSTRALLASVTYFLGIFAGQWPSRTERYDFSHKGDLECPYWFARYYIQVHFRSFVPVTSLIASPDTEGDTEGLKCLREDIQITSDALKVLPHLFQERRISIFGVLSSTGDGGLSYRSKPRSVPAFYRVLVLAEAGMDFPLEVNELEVSGLKWCAGLEGTIAFHAAVFASVGPWEMDWNNVLDQIDDCLRLELKNDLKPEKLKQWMFDDDFERSKLYFTILQILRIFGEYIRTMSADLHQLDDLFVAGARGFPLREITPDELHVMQSNWESVLKVQKAAEKRLLDRLLDKTEEVKSLRDGV